ncbi:MAG: hypothetical protein CR997_06590 [Acidobacteria bacterium]|nr:MAG: hypothetical protein CR997_06590 [Acidobacteriota bacterium]
MRSWILLSLVIGMLVGCSKEDAYDKIRKLETEGKAVEAKQLFESFLAENEDKALERSYIQFLFDNKFYLDFNREANRYLLQNPNDLTIKNLNFRYYAILAENAERQGDYDQALTYIVNNLLSRDYEDHQYWELQQSNVLRKWYAQEKSKEENTIGKKYVMSQMISLGLENLAKSLDPELYEAMNLNPATEEFQKK